MPVELVKPDELEQPTTDQPQVNVITKGEAESANGGHCRKHLIILLQDKQQDITEGENTQLVTLLQRYGNVFSLVEGERGETSLLKLHIDTGDAIPKKQPVRRVQFAVKQVASQIRKMQEGGVIQTLGSQWPVG